MNATEIPGAAKALLKKLDGWSVESYAGTGPCEFGGLSEETDGEGKSHRITYTEVVESFGIYAVHADHRVFVVVWIRRPGYYDVKKKDGTVESKRNGWSHNQAWRREYVAGGGYHPKRMTATELKAYIEPPLALDLKEAA